MFRGNGVEGSGAFGQFEQSRQMQYQGGLDRRDMVLMQQPQQRFAQDQHRREPSSPNLNLPHASQTQTRQIPQQTDHFQAQHRPPSHSTTHQPVAYHTSNGHPIPPSQHLPSHSQTHSQSPHLVQRQQLSTQQPHPSQFQQQQVRYNPSQQREQPLPSPQIAATPTQFSSAPSPYTASPSTYAPSPTHQVPHHRQPALPHPAARRVEQSIAANLPPSTNSPRTNRQPPYPTPSHSIQSNRPTQSNPTQHQSTPIIQEETPVAGPSNSRQQPQMTTRFVEFEPPSATSISQSSSVLPLQTEPEITVSIPIREDKTITIFHSYVLDYLQRNGFHTTAAAFLSENPSISLHSAESGRVCPSNSSILGSTSTRSHTTSPTSNTNPPSRTSPTSAPLFRSESGSSPISPTQQDAQNHSTVESTSSTSSTSTFGFERTKGNGTDDELPSPGEEKGDGGKASRRGTVPAANVEYEVESGYLYEWFHVFYDVHSARTGKGGSLQARSLVQANAATPSVGSRTQINSARRVPVLQQRPRPPITVDTARTQARPTLGARRMSGVANLQQASEVPGRTVVNRAAPFQQPTSSSTSQAPSLSRRNSQQLYLEQQQESQARQQALQERQRLQQVQMEQQQMQRQMMDKLQQEAQQITARQKSLSVSFQPPTPVASGLPGRSNESFSIYHASLGASQRSQLQQGSPTLSNAEISPGRFVGRQGSQGVPMVKAEDFSRPNMPRTHSQPHIQQIVASPLDGLMPPPPSTSAPHSRPPLGRSASSSFVQQDQATPKLSDLTGNSSSKRRRESLIDLSDQSEMRELKKARSSVDLGGATKISSTKSLLSLETDFTASSPPLSTAEPSIVPSQAKTPIERRSNPSTESPRKQDFTPMNDTDAFLASLNASSDITNDTTANDELEVPTMTDAELDAFFAASMNEIDQTSLDAQAKGAPVSIPESADFDFTEYNSFFGAGSASYDPTTFDLNA